jgi:hypothetical protein
MLLVNEFDNFVSIAVRRELTFQIGPHDGQRTNA